MTTYLKYTYSGVNSFVYPEFNDEISVIQVFVNEIPTEFIFVNTDLKILKIKDDSVLIDGDIVEIMRVTNENREAFYNDGSTLYSETLNKDNEQVFSLIQENLGQQTLLLDKIENNIKEAIDIPVDTTTFETNLSPTDINVQVALETIDKTKFASFSGNGIEVMLASIDNVGFNSITVSGFVISGGDSNSLDIGFKYKKSSDSVWIDVIHDTNVVGDNYSYQHEITGLNVNTSYDVRAFVRNSLQYSLYDVSNTNVVTTNDHITLELYEEWDFTNWVSGVSIYGVINNTELRTNNVIFDNANSECFFISDSGYIQDMGDFTSVGEYIACFVSITFNDPFNKDIKFDIYKQDGDNLKRIIFNFTSGGDLEVSDVNGIFETISGFTDDYINNGVLNTIGFIVESDGIHIAVNGDDIVTITTTTIRPNQMFHVGLGNIDGDIKVNNIILVDNNLQAMDQYTIWYIDKYQKGEL